MLRLVFLITVLTPVVTWSSVLLHVDELEQDPGLIRKYLYGPFPSDAVKNMYIIMLDALHPQAFDLLSQIVTTYNVGPRDNDSRLAFCIGTVVRGDGSELPWSILNFNDTKDPSVALNRYKAEVDFFNRMESLKLSHTIIGDRYNPCTRLANDTFKESNGYRSWVPTVGLVIVSVDRMRRFNIRIDIPEFCDNIALYGPYIIVKMDNTADDVWNHIAYACNERWRDPRQLIVHWNQVGLQGVISYVNQVTNKTVRYWDCAYREQMRVELNPEKTGCICAFYFFTILKGSPVVGKCAKKNYTETCDCSLESSFSEYEETTTSTSTITLGSSESTVSYTFKRLTIDDDSASFIWLLVLGGIVAVVVQASIVYVVIMKWKQAKVAQSHAASVVSDVSKTGTGTSTSTFPTGWLKKLNVEAGESREQQSSSKVEDKKLKSVNWSWSSASTAKLPASPNLSKKLPVSYV